MSEPVEDDGSPLVAKQPVLLIFELCAPICAACLADMVQDAIRKEVMERAEDDPGSPMGPECADLARGGPLQ